jgi:hypothetical protein
MVRLRGPADLREIMAMGFLLTFTDGLADEDVSEEVADHFLAFTPGLSVDQPEAVKEVPEV